VVAVPAALEAAVPTAGAQARLGALKEASADQIVVLPRVVDVLDGTSVRGPAAQRPTSS
jgi:hypothetical protein